VYGQLDCTIAPDGTFTYEAYLKTLDPGHYPAVGYVLYPCPVHTELTEPYMQLVDKHEKLLGLIRKRHAQLMAAYATAVDTQQGTTPRSADIAAAAETGALNRSGAQGRAGSLTIEGFAVLARRHDDDARTAVLAVRQLEEEAADRWLEIREAAAAEAVELKRAADLAWIEAADQAAELRRQADAIEQPARQAYGNAAQQLAWWRSHSSLSLGGSGELANQLWLAREGTAPAAETREARKRRETQAAVRDQEAIDRANAVKWQQLQADQANELARNTAAENERRAAEMPPTINEGTPGVSAPSSVAQKARDA
jgi:hypothetical protein